MILVDVLDILIAKQLQLHEILVIGTKCEILKYVMSLAVCTYN